MAQLVTWVLPLKKYDAALQQKAFFFIAILSVHIYRFVYYMHVYYDKSNLILKSSTGITLIYKYIRDGFDYFFTLLIFYTYY